MDDTLVAHRDSKQVLRSTTVVHTCYKVKYLGELSNFRGLGVRRTDAHEIRMSQMAYVTEMLNKFAMDPVQPI